MTLPYLDSEKRKELVKHKAKTLSRYKHLLSTLFKEQNPLQKPSTENMKTFSKG